jgi:hypothetical protein
MLSFLLELYGEQWYGVSNSDNKETIATRYVWILWKKRREYTLEEMFIINLRDRDVMWNESILGSIHWRKC